MERVTIEVSELREKIVSILKKAGLSAGDAGYVADSLIDAEICRVESHGLMRLAPYVERIQKGLINPRPVVKMEKRDAIIRVDGGNGMGPIVARRTMEECVKGALQYGVCFAAVKNSNHFGMASSFTRIASKAGCIGFSCTTAGPTMAPFGGMDKLLGTDSFSVAFPAGADKQFILDIAVSAVAKGKIRIFEQEGKEIPLGWAMDSDGLDTKDPSAAVKGILLPMAGHKGYGMAIVIEMLSAVLSGAKLSCESESMFSGSGAANIGHFMGALDIAHFLDPREFQERVASWFDCLKASRCRPNVSRIMIPGEPEEEMRRREIKRLDVLKQTWLSIEKLV